MGKNNENNTSIAKRWATIIGIFVLVAIVVVVIILCIPPNTYNAVETLNRVSKTSYLTVESEETSFEKFKTKINSSVVSYYGQELSDIQTLSVVIDEILDYHNEYLVFAKDNKNLKDNYKAIKEGLQNAQNNQKRLVKLIEKTNSLSDESSTYLQSAMVDYRKEYSKYLKTINRAIGGLENAYTGSLGKVSFNNPASKLILNTINDYINVISGQFAELAKKDVKGGRQADYTENYKNTLSITSKINAFKKFVDTNLSSEEIIDYYFDSVIEDKYTSLNDFFKLYSEKNLYNVIKSIDSTNQVTKTYEDVTDNNNTYQAIKNFVLGGV